MSAACAVDPPVSTRVALHFDRDGHRVQITSTTNLKRDWEAGASQPRLASAREPILAGTDEWANRFAAMETERQRATLDWEFGDLTRAERTAVAERDQLQQFFGDTSLTLQLTSGEGWTELTIWTGTASRATDEQRNAVEVMLDGWSRDGARYIEAVGALYEYLDARPKRAQPLLAILFAGEDHHAEDEREEAFLQDVRASLRRILARIDTSRNNAFSIDEQFDLAFNPFPAPMTVQTPSAILAAENFTRIGPDSVEIPRAGITDALQTLEGLWVSPDPLAILVRADGETKPPNAETIAGMKRKHTSAVTSADVRQAIVNALQRSDLYRVRWKESRAAH